MKCYVQISSGKGEQLLAWKCRKSWPLDILHGTLLLQLQATLSYDTTPRDTIRWSWKNFSFYLISWQNFFGDQSLPSVNHMMNRTLTKPQIKKKLPVVWKQKHCCTCDICILLYVILPCERPLAGSHVCCSNEPHWVLEPLCGKCQRTIKFAFGVGKTWSG